MIRNNIIIIGILTIFSFDVAVFAGQSSEKKMAYDPGNAIILCFHDIDGQGKYSITTEEFQGILDLLKGKYEVYSLQRWHEKVKKGQAFGKRPVILTFDDGYESMFTRVVPLLSKYSFGATFFIYLDRYDERSSAYRLISKLPGDFEIGSHSFSHADMLSLYKKDPKAFYREIFLSRKKLGYLTGKEITSWAWPFGYYNPEMEEMARHAGYEIQVNTDYKVTRNQWDKQSFSRFTVQQPEPVIQVKEILQKNYP